MTLTSVLGQPAEPAKPRIGVLVVAYNAATTLRQTLDRIPAAFRDQLDHVLVCDDASQDETYQVGLEYKSGSTLPLTVIKHVENLRYGGNQKFGYRWAIQEGLDIVVMLHGDGQYAPEVMEELVSPLVSGEADVVMGSRMMERGSALKGGMPVYKYMGNRILTRFQNAMTGASLTEWHSGYRAYRTDALRDVPFAEYSNDFDFDTEIILGMLAARKRIIEVPIPTYYGDEICYVNGLAYARDVAIDVTRHRARQMGFGRSGGGIDTQAYEVKHSPHSSHGQLLDWLTSMPASTVLDVGCSDGHFAGLVRSMGHHVVGVDLVKHDGVGERVDSFVEADLNAGLPDEAGSGYGVIVAGDVLEHVIDPDALMADMKSRLADDGTILVSVPNFGHWYPRLRTASGTFDYDQRGPLDRGHVRFFTRRSFEKLIANAGLRVVERRTVGSPLDVLERGASPVVGRAAKIASAVDRAAVKARPTFFGYQFLYKLERV
ncbi:bifunctional glycosyltransferase/class I SAM-dependent methyltransferase [Knoellia sp. CPCC 206453]|uniref:bifunctional glycosyltransferase/class I SAM-dependent methyltransferase n=1 Tax=Knoellia pratensis TaxID=3404796 RepID=UPI00361E0CB5